jgi:hypothetical protein
MLWWMAPLRRTAMGGPIGWRAIRRRPCTRLGSAGLRLRFHWLWPCALRVCRRGVCRFGMCGRPFRMCGRLFRMCCRLLGTRGVAFDRLCLRLRGWLWWRRSVAFGCSCCGLCLRLRGWLRGPRSVVFGWSCCWLCCGVGSPFRLRLCVFGRPGLPVVLRFRMILCMQRGRQRRGETTKENPVKQPGRRACFHCHDSLSVLKNVRADAGEGESLGINLSGLDAVSWRPRLGFVRRVEVR